MAAMMSFHAATWWVFRQRLPGAYAAASA